MSQNRTRVSSNCIVCGKGFMAILYDTKIGKGKCCSLSCAATLAAKNRDQKGSANNNWKGGLSNQSNSERKRRYRENNPAKHKAHIDLRNAIRKGILAKSPCEVCGDIKVEGHHDNYLFPLSVRWLCKKHHLDVHGGKFSKSQLESSPVC